MSDSIEEHGNHVHFYLFIVDMYVQYVLVYVHPDVQTCYWLDIKSSSQKHVVLAVECAQVWSNISLADSLHKIWSTNDCCIYTKGALSIGKGQIYLVLYEYYVGSYQANIS